MCRPCAATSTGPWDRAKLTTKAQKKQRSTKERQREISLLFFFVSLCVLCAFVVSVLRGARFGLFFRPRNPTQEGLPFLAGAARASLAPSHSDPARAQPRAARSAGSHRTHRWPLCKDARMARYGLSVCLCAALVVAAARSAPPAEDRDSALMASLAVQTAMQQGREHLLQNRSRAAVEVLEAQIGRINGNQTYLILLR